MILIADGGSTKCDWVIADTSKAEIVKSFQTEGINPFAKSEEQIYTLLKDSVAPQIEGYNIERIAFFGAGVTVEKSAIMQNLLKNIAPEADVAAQSDMEAAVKSAIGDGDGVVVILGTGSNSACYESGAVVEKVASLGYILGDEGSGAHLGKTLVSDCLKGVAPKHITELFYAETNLTQADILEAVYRKGQANRYLAGFAKFISSHLDDSYIYHLVEGCFELFVHRNLAGYSHKNIYAVGSIAYYFREVLDRVLLREGFTLKSVAKSPIKGLVDYYSGVTQSCIDEEEHHFYKITESPSYYNNLESMSVGDCLRSISYEDHHVADAVQRALPQIESLVEQLIPRLKKGGRLFYMGAGTSGRLGVLDASEVPPTFGMPPTVIIGIIAGGDTALRNPVEGAEDDTEQGWRDLERFNPTPLDTVVGIAASGTTPYVVGVLRRARQEGLLTASIASNRNSAAAEEAHIAIETVVGPEFVTGSSRMKSGTAQKMVCNMITTAAMIGIGRVKGNRMVNMQLSNKKLVDRGTRMIVDILGLDYKQAHRLLLLHGSVQKAVEAYQNACLEGL